MQKEIRVACGLLITASGYVLVHELGYHKDKLLKCPGGQTDGQNATDAIIREIYEEIGVRISESDIKNFYDIDRGNYMMRFFNVNAEYVKFDELKKGPEIEFLKLFRNKKDLEMAICYEDVIPCHAAAITELLKTA